MAVQVAAPTETVQRGGLADAPPAGRPIRRDGASRRGDTPRERSAWRRTWRTWRTWLPLTLALALAAAGAVAAIATAYQAVAPAAGRLLGAQQETVTSTERLTAAPAGPLESALALTRALTRSAIGPAGQAMDVLFAPPEYFQRSGQPALAAQYGADRFLVFFVTETAHSDSLPPPLQPVLALNGRLIAAEPPMVLMDAVHHRTTVVRFASSETAAGLMASKQAASVEFLVPAGERGSAATLRWELPLPPVETPAGRRLPGIGSMLALLGGLLAAMWPCLFQLTAYFIPSVAGLSMAEADGQAGAAARRQVVHTALLFVAGIVVVYTLAGAAAGYATQTPGARNLFDDWRRPLSIAGALLIGAMAIRMALRARAPMACHMPMFSPLERLGRSAAGTMLLGVAFATGCMTCFGAAITLGMFTYVASTGSVAMGALTLFIFSLGFAVPLVVGSMLMARVLPVLDRLQRVTPALTLASSAVLLGFAALLLTDRYHLVSDALVRLALGG
ncbi:MAG: sulfite exporter TauE/SafE family protein [Chloroflexi bacterium]|nr:sulfite exporter TauE/SafE family protein [Chloroflexota bacterium]